MDLIRNMVLALRDSNTILQGLPGVSEISFNEHAKLLSEAGLVEAKFLSSNPPTAAILFRLTWDGQDFADSIKEDTIWNKVKDKLLKPTVSFTFPLLLEFVTQEVKQSLFS